MSRNLLAAGAVLFGLNAVLAEEFTVIIKKIEPLELVKLHKQLNAAIKGKDDSEASRLREKIGMLEKDGKTKIYGSRRPENKVGKERDVVIEAANLVKVTKASFSKTTKNLEAGDPILEGFGHAMFENIGKGIPARITVLDMKTTGIIILTPPKKGES